MSSIEELDKVLTQLCNEMVDSTNLIEDLQFEPVRENIRKVGTAIYELSELRSDIYKLRPDLKPEKWDEPPSGEAYGEMYEKALSIVQEHLNNQLPAKAIETLESYLYIGPNKKYEAKALTKIQKLRQKHGL